jgi:prevent-host-death family protein
MPEIGAYEAKTHLPQLLKRIQQGEQFVITKHGRPVAELVPVSRSNPDAIQHTITKIRSFRETLRKRGVHITRITQGRRATSRSQPSGTPILMSLVLDSSVALAWALPDESNWTLDPLLDRLITENMMVPQIWPLEMGDVLLVAVRRGRLTAQDMTLLVQEFRALPVEIDTMSTEESLKETLLLARKYELTTYDFSYIELAKRRDLPLATLDTKLRKVCLATHIRLLPSNI